MELSRQKGSHTFLGCVYLDPCISPSVNILIWAHFLESNDRHLPNCLWAAPKALHNLKRLQWSQVAVGEKRTNVRLPFCVSVCSLLPASCTRWPFSCLDSLHLQDLLMRVWTRVHLRCLSSLPLPPPKPLCIHPAPHLAFKMPQARLKSLREETIYVY